MGKNQSVWLSCYSVAAGMEIWLVHSAEHCVSIPTPQEAHVIKSYLTRGGFFKLGRVHLDLALASPVGILALDELGSSCSVQT